MDVNPLFDKLDSYFRRHSVQQTFRNPRGKIRERLSLDSGRLRYFFGNFLRKIYTFFGWFSGSVWKNIPFVREVFGTCSEKSEAASGNLRKLPSTGAYFSECFVGLVIGLSEPLKNPIRQSFGELRLTYLKKKYAQLFSMIASFVSSNINKIFGLSSLLSSLFSKPVSFCKA